MSDRIEGVALLAPWEGVEYLHALCVRENGDCKPWRLCLPVRPKDAPENPKSMTWQYTVRGDMLEVQPSVKINGGDPPKEIFHNEGVWRVRFERFTPSPDIIWKDGIGDHGQRARFIELNPGDYSV